MRLIKNKGKWKGIIGIALIVVSLALSYAWEAYGRQELTYTDVIVFTENVDAHKEVMESMLSTKKVSNDSLVDGAIKDANVIIGKRTANFIPKDMQLVPEFFSNAELAIGEDKFIFSIPGKWLYTYPQTLRRGDKIYFYTIKNDTDTNTSNIDFSTSEEALDLADILGPVIEATVAYVKDSVNREVVNMTGSDRYDGSANAAQIEIIITEDQLNRLESAYNEGLQFILLYN